jgi:hypothetical protein
MTFLPAPRVVIKFDPESVAADPPGDVDPAGPLDLSTSYDEEDWWLAKPASRARYAAWPAAFPWLVGEGETARNALADLASALRHAQCYPECSDTPPIELVHTARRLGNRELVAYLEELSGLPQLADEYDLVLR